MPIGERLTTIEGILDTHTKALDQLLAEKRDREQEAHVANLRFKRLEDWAKQVSEKVGIKIEF